MSCFWDNQNFHKVSLQLWQEVIFPLFVNTNIFCRCCCDSVNKIDISNFRCSQCECLNESHFVTKYSQNCELESYYFREQFDQFYPEFKTQRFDRLFAFPRGDFCFSSCSLEAAHSQETTYTLFSAACDTVLFLRMQPKVLLCSQAMPLTLAHHVK